MVKTPFQPTHARTPGWLAGRLDGSRAGAARADPRGRASARRRDGLEGGRDRGPRRERASASAGVSATTLIAMTHSREPHPRSRPRLSIPLYLALHM